MAVPGVEFSFTTGALGRVEQVESGVSALIANGVAVTDGLELGTTYLLTSLEDAERLGINADYDTDGGWRVYKHVREFYQLAGAGTELYLHVVAEAVTLTQMVQNSGTAVASILALSDGRVRQIGVTRAGELGTITSGIEADVTAALAAAQTHAEVLALQGMPVLFVVEGRGISSTFGSVLSLRTLSNDRTCVVAADTEASTGAAVGLYLGTLAAITASVNPGSNEAPSLGIAVAYIAGADIRTYTYSSRGVLANKGYVCLGTRPGSKTLVWLEGPMATVSTSDYAFVTERRVIDEATRVAQAVYLQQVLGRTKAEPDGKILASSAKHLENLITTGIQDAMGTEISGVKAFVDPQQVILGTDEVTSELKVQPLGYYRIINVKLGLTRSLN